MVGPNTYTNAVVTVTGLVSAGTVTGGDTMMASTSAWPR